MQSILAVLTLLCISVVLSDANNVIVPCKKSDELCMTKSANIALPIIAAGIPSLGVDGFDPARIQEISGETSNLVYNFTNNEVFGYSKCIISDVKLNLEALNLKFDINCNSLVAFGHLVISGDLLDVPVEGIMITKLVVYLIRVDADIEKYKGADERQHLAITDFKHIGIPYDPLKFNYDNFNPKKELSPEAAADFEKNKFAKAGELITGTFINTLYKGVIFKNINKLFESVPLEDMFID